MAAWVVLVATANPAAAQANPAEAPSTASPSASPPVTSGPAASLRIPNFWDLRLRLDRPTLPRNRVVRVLTDDDYPPLHFAGPDGVPTGFAVELARAACEILELTCTIQPRRFDLLLDALREGGGDVVAAAVPIRSSLRAAFGVTQPYHRTPARFVSWSNAAFEVSPAGLAGRTIAVVAATAHEAYLEAFFPAVTRRAYPSLALALDGLRKGEAEAVFADGLTLSLWLAGQDSGGCCAFRGGPYLESAFFGEGVGFVTRLDDDGLRRAFDYALQRLWERGTYAELYLRFFPLSFY